jgi:hypothetical protein
LPREFEVPTGFLAWAKLQVAAVKPSVWIVVLLVLAFVALAFYASRQHQERLRAERNAEVTELKAKGLVVALDEKTKGLQTDLNDLAKQFSGLQAALDDAKKKAGATKLVEVDHFVTVPGPVLPVPGDSPDGGCALALGDTGEVRIAELRLQTKKGNDLAVGVAEAWRVSPGLPVRLFSSQFSAATSLMEVDLDKVTAAKPPGWGGGPLGVAGTSGVGGGVIVVSPVFPFLFSLKAEVAGFAAISQGGAQAGLGFIIRE